MTPETITNLKEQATTALVEYGNSNRGVLEIFDLVNKYLEESGANNPNGGPGEIIRRRETQVGELLNHCIKSLNKAQIKKVEKLLIHIAKFGNN